MKETLLQAHSRSRGRALTGRPQKARSRTLILRLKRERWPTANLSSGLISTLVPRPPLWRRRFRSAATLGTAGLRDGAQAAGLFSGRPRPRGRTARLLSAARPAWARSANLARRCERVNSGISCGETRVGTGMGSSFDGGRDRSKRSSGDAHGTGVQVTAVATWLDWLVVSTLH